MSLFEYARLSFLKYRREQARNRRFCVLSKQTTSVNGFAKMHCKQTLHRHSKTCLFAIAYGEEGKRERRPKQLLRYVFCYLFATKKIYLSIYLYMDRHTNIIIAYRSLKKLSLRQQNTQRNIDRKRINQSYSFDIEAPMLCIFFDSSIDMEKGDSN